MDLILHILQNSFINESRVIKTVDAQLEAIPSAEVLVIGLHQSGQPEVEYIHDRMSIRRIKCWLSFNPGKMNVLHKVALMLEWNLRILFLFRNKKIKMINIHSVEVLPLGVLMKYLKKPTLVYEPHELEARKVEGNSLLNRVYSWLEFLFIGAADHVLVVSRSIADWYENNYRLSEVHCARNISSLPLNKPKFELRDHFGIPPDHLVFVLSGHLHLGRSIEFLLNIWGDVDKRELVVIGNGQLETTVLHAAHKYLNIHHLDELPQEELLGVLSTADVGICLIENLCLSLYYSSPNKLFEYLKAGLPVVASNFPDMAETIREGELGWLVEKKSHALKTIRGITLKDIEARKDRIWRLGLPSWEDEKKSLIEMYSNETEL